MDSTALLEETRTFWNANPCDGGSSVADRTHYRFSKETWLTPLLRRIAEQHAAIVEVGCGQGTDSIEICRAMMAADGEYLGLDFSDASVASAREGARAAVGLRVAPRFEVANCEALPFADGAVECVYSMGVLHHTPNTERAVAEVFRVLKPGGRAYIALYRRSSPKVFGAHALRFIQAVVDRISGRRRSLLPLARLASLRGTAILECFGVPILRSYSQRGMRRLFAEFAITHLEAVGPLKSFWIVEVRKPPT